MTSKDDLSFKAQDCNLGQALFHHDFKFRVPRYQRPYAWGEDEVIQFWNDLNGDDDGIPFFGSLIFNDEFKDKKYIEIIDGQQRVITVTIFMAVLRDIAYDLRLRSADSLNKSIAFFDRRGVPDYRVQCGESLKSFFENTIQKFPSEVDIVSIRPKTKEHKRIQKNYLQLRKLVEDELDKMKTIKEKESYLYDLQDEIYDLGIIEIRIKNDADAYVIFETVNDRGVGLSVSDLLKNLIFKHVQGDQNGADEAQQKWREIEDNIQEANTEMVTFIRHWWLSKYSHVGEKRLYKAIRNSDINYSDFLNELLEASDLYRKILIGREDDWKDVKDGIKIYKSLEGIRFMRVTQCYVLLLSLLENASKINTSLVPIFQVIEKFTFNYSAVCKLQANRVEKFYSKSALQFSKTVSSGKDKYLDSNVQRNLNSMISKLRDFRPKKGEFKEKFLDLSYRNSENNRVFIKYFFDRINAQHTPGREHKLDFEIVNIEHILPQNPSKWGLSKKSVNAYVNLIGNLTLVGKHYNSAAGNEPLPKKIKALEKSEIAITKKLIDDIKNNPVWGESDIRKRQEDLAKEAYENVWNY